MDLGDRKVFIGVAPNSSATATLDGNRFSACNVDVTGPLVIPAIGNVVEEIERHRTQAPVLDDIIHDVNIADDSIDPNLSFNPLAPPLHVAAGGTSLSNVPHGHLLAGNDSNALAVPENVTWSNQVMSILGTLSIGPYALSVGNDDLGRRSFFVTDSENHVFDLVAAASKEPVITAVNVVPANGQLTLCVTVESHSPRTVHCVWNESTGATMSRAQVHQDSLLAAAVSRFNGKACFTICGLQPGQSYDVHIVARDSRGNLSAVELASGTPTGTKWEFLISAMSAFDPSIFAIESSFGVTPDNLELESGWHHVFDGNADLKVAVTNDIESNDRLSFSGGQKLWTITDDSHTESPTFTITWSRAGHAPGIEIRRDDQTVYIESDNNGDGIFPEYNSRVYSAPPRVTWEFFALRVPPPNVAMLYAIDSPTFDVTPSNLTMSSAWYNYQGNPIQNEVAVTQHSDEMVANNLSPSGKEHLWTIIQDTETTTTEFDLKWSIPRYTPGLEIRRNGVTVLADSANEGNDTEPAVVEKSYTINTP